MTVKRIDDKWLLRAALLVVAAGILTTAAGAWGAEEPDAASLVSRNVRVNAPQQLFPLGNPTRSSTTIAASGDGLRLLAGFESFEGLCGPPAGLACPPLDPPGIASYAFSTDGGRTWTDSGGAPFALGNAIPAGHPWAARLGHGGEGRDDRDGSGEKETFFYSAVLEDATTGAPAGLGVYRGHFHGGGFAFADGQLINAANPGDMYSREAVAAGSAAGDSAYMVLINVDEICGIPFAGFGQVELWRTHDGGDSWQGPAVVSPETSTVVDPTQPGCGRNGFLQIAPAVAVGPDGEVYVVWQYGPQFFPDGSNAPNDAIGFARSLDGGSTFEPFSTIAPINAMRSNPPVGYGQNRMNDQPRIAVATDGPHRGRIYVSMYSAASPVSGPTNVQSLVSSQAFLAYSDDRGVTWSAPTPLAPAVPPTGLKRFWSTVTAHRDGDVDVVYLESQEVPTGTPCSVPILATVDRTGPASSLVNTFRVESHDGGVSFGPPVRVSSATSNWCTAPYTFASGVLANFGFYIGAAAAPGRTLAVWPDDRGGPADVFFAGIARDPAEGRRLEAAESSDDQR
jgi:hypothetical protein